LTRIRERAARRGAEAYLRVALLVVALGFVAVYVLIALRRIGYPYELNWVEGAMVDGARRVIDGQSLYTEPSLGFTADIYPPLYYVVSGAASYVLGTGFLAPRLVSFLASLGVFFLVYLLVSRETGNRRAGVLGACLFAATFQIGGAWFDLARVDSLYLLLLLGAVVLARFSTSSRGVVAAAACLVLAYLTKQPALFVTPALALYLWRRDRRLSLIFAGAFAIGWLGSAVIANALTDGWYRYYVLELPQQHPWLPSALRTFFTDDLLPPMSIAILVTLFFLGSRATSSSSSSERPDHALWLYLPLGIAMVSSAGVARLHVGGYDNTLLPAYLFLSIGFGLGVGEALARTAVASPREGALLRSLLYCACLLQFALLVYNPLGQIPDSGDVAAGDRTVAAIKRLPGPVFIPFHPDYAVAAGKPSHGHAAFLHDVLRGHPSNARTQLQRSIAETLDARCFGAVVLDSDAPPGMLDDYDLSRSYVRAGPLLKDGGTPRPQTGARIIPDLLYLPRNPRPVGASASGRCEDAEG